MSILELLTKEMKEPMLYSSFANSWFHYLSLLVTVILVIWSIKYLNKKSVNDVRKYILVFALTLIGFELYKQIIFTYQNDWTYPWYIFPFQFCSIPMYVGLIIGLSKKQMIYDYGVSFLITYGLFAGLAVMIYPEQVFIKTIGINIQTMVHHGGMTVVGLSLLFTRKVELRLKTMFKAAVVFAIVLSAAVIFNFFHNQFIGTPTFNMFFINAKYKNHLPILTHIQPLVSDDLFVIIYFLGFSMVSYITFLINLIIFKSTRMNMITHGKVTQKNR